MGTTKSGAQRLFTTLRGASLAAVTGLSLLLMSAGSASALSGSTIGAAAPTSHSTITSITFNTSGTVTIVFVPVQSGEAELLMTVPTLAKTVAGKTSGHGTAGSPLKLKVQLSSKIKALLEKGKTVHLSAKLTYKSALGGTPTVKYYNLTVKGPEHKK